MFYFNVFNLVFIITNLNSSCINIFRNNKGIFPDGFLNFKRNPEKKDNLSQLNDVCNGNNLEGLESTDSDNKSKNLENSTVKNNKISRVELLFGSAGLKRLNSSNVFVIGANELSSKIITHLIRSGVSSVTVWDENKSLTRAILKEILILNPDANVKILHTDLLEHLSNYKYSAVIISNQPILTAIKFNKLFHKKINIVYASVSGCAGIVLNDFGDHKVHVTSDETYEEDSARILQLGEQSCLEVDSSKLSQYSKNDIIEVRYKEHGSENKLSQFKILNVDKSSEGSLKLWIDTRNDKLRDTVVSVRKVDKPEKLHFNTFESLINSVLTVNKFLNFVKRIFTHESIEKLVIGPDNNSSLNSKLVTVLASFIALSKTNSYNLPPESHLDLENFYAVTKQVYSESDYKVVSNFNCLKDFKIPSIISLIGGLAAQECIKAITHTFKPSDLILVDRSDIFSDESGQVDAENVRKSMSQVSKMSFLVVGSGALGCDYLKLLAEMGVSDVTLFDNDTVDVSNLSRQALFTINDIGKPKAQVAVRNLNLLHNTSGYKYYNRIFTEDSFELFDRHISEGNNYVAISAVDNIEGRVALDNFCLLNNLPMIESGIHGMKCIILRLPYTQYYIEIYIVSSSTSFMVPYITESFSSSMGDEAVSSDRYSCSVKGIPSNIDDCVFYSIELFSWIFNTQHMILNNFVKDPVKALEQAVKSGKNNFHNLIQIVYENLEIINSDEKKKEYVVNQWAKMKYDKYVGHESEYKNKLISALVNLKLKALKNVGIQPVNMDYDKFNLILNHGYKEFGDHMSGNKFRKEDFQRLVDVFVCNSRKNTNYEFNPLVIEEDCNDSTDFVYFVSNLRARKFNIPEASKTNLVRKAKNIVPAVSTSVSIASSLSLMELYKLPIIKSTIVSSRCMKEDRNGLSGLPTSLKNGNELVINDNVKLNLFVNKSEINFCNGDKTIFTLRPFNYSKLDYLCGFFKNHFFNSATMKYVTNTCEPPKVFTIDNKNSILNGLSLSYWDQFIIREHRVHADGLTKSSQHTVPYKFNSRNIINGPNTYCKLRPKELIYLYELVDLLEFIFDIKVDGLTFKNGYLIVGEHNRFKPLQDLLNHRSGQLFLHIIARDNKSNKVIELPDIKYSII
ncbi:ubiquitin-activating enzyme, putative [Theileria annulata]|uniref:Ubiquitin-activating enzyme, putative n=1 Tax=Theileria annulata TaxID=5874 RepID=Q4UE32_THEAN|nr:ubiquitin-activating enzyme, putative [Theileria annulata]CAI74657.1 ubiquitin-activating enzyme, putative [Theileria annulata]|eukprot:XP_952389.1 ubiquitin-activating enzyme, putative [Theileria annulata]